MNMCERLKRCNRQIYEFYEMEWSITILAVVRFYSRRVIKKNYLKTPYPNLGGWKMNCKVLQRKKLI